MGMEIGGCMTFEQIFKYALFSAFGVYVLMSIIFLKIKKHKARRLEIAQQKGWMVLAHTVKSKTINRATGKDYDVNREWLSYVSVYEYEIEGKRKTVKLESAESLPYEKAIYYDAEHKNEILNINTKNPIKVILLMTAIIFVGVILILRNIFGV